LARSGGGAGVTDWRILRTAEKRSEKKVIKTLLVVVKE
jgi:hypothetical protein